MSPERLFHTVRLSLQSLTGHRLQSALTILGIVLGVASVIVMLAIGEAARYEAVRQFRELGATNIIVRSVKPAADMKIDDAEVLTYGLTLADMERIHHTIPSVVSVTPLREFRRPLRHVHHDVEGRVVAVMSNFQELNGLRLACGRFISNLDNEEYANVVVLGAEVAEILFPLGDPVGKSIRIDETQFYRVVGVTESKPTPAAGGQDYNRDVYIPFNTDRVRFGSVLMEMKQGSFKFEKLEVSQLTVIVDDIAHVRRTAEIIKGTLEQFHPRKDTEVTVPLDLLERTEKTQQTFTLVLGAIAGISLLVGGIGIMNIMLATVTERTREIGIRRALGAKRRDIAVQFLIETVMLSATGGLLGVGLGLALSHGVTRVFSTPTILKAWAPLLAFAFSVVVGLIFGMYPARRAARMDPIEALRHE
jgi:putative ABC transport system permease protein